MNTSELMATLIRGMGPDGKKMVHMIVLFPSSIYLPHDIYRAYAPDGKYPRERFAFAGKDKLRGWIVTYHMNCLEPCETVTVAHPSHGHAPRDWFLVNLPLIEFIDKDLNSVKIENAAAEICLQIPCGDRP